MGKTVRVQEVGYAPTKKANKLKKGDTLLFNFGYTAKVQKVENKGKSVYITAVGNGKKDIIRKNRSTSIPIIPKKRRYSK